MRTCAVGRSLTVMVRYLRTAVVVGALACGCGASGKVMSSQPSQTTAPGHVSTAALASCLRSVGATVTTRPGEVEEGVPWREEGEIEAHLGETDVMLGVMTTERGARYHLAAGVGLAGGPTLDGNPIKDVLGRVRNVSVELSAPDTTTRKAVERCLGEPLRFDPAKI
jgi:hypothetical protein